MTHVHSQTDLLERAVELVRSYLETARDSAAPVVRYRPPAELRAQLDLELPEGHGSPERLLAAIEQYLRWSVRTAHPQYFNQLWAGFTMPGFLGDVVASLTNTSVYTYEVAPVATLLELEVTRELCERAGFPAGEATFVTGGSNANLVAMLVARHRQAPAAREHGLRGAGTGALTAFVSDQAHYSFARAANVLGIGTANLVAVPADGRGRMIPAELDRRITESRARGQEPFMVAATAGTTVLGAFDPLPAIAAVARQRQLWFHVDGAFGGPALFSRRHHHLLDGLEQADSFTLDLHKLVGLPLITSLICMRQAGQLRDAVAGGHTDYIFHAGGTAEYDRGSTSLQCGRRVNVLKLWLAWQYFGAAGFEQRLDRLFELAAHAERIVEREPGLELAAPRQSVTVCFRIEAPPGHDPDGFQVAVREQLVATGASMVNYARLRDGRVAIRLVLANPEITTAEVERFFANVRRAAGEVGAA